MRRGGFLEVRCSVVVVRGFSSCGVGGEVRSFPPLGYSGGVLRAFHRVHRVVQPFV